MRHVRAVCGWDVGLRGVCARAESNDAEFDDYQRSFAEMEKAAEKLLKDAKTFSDAVTCASQPIHIVLLFLT